MYNILINGALRSNDEEHEKMEDEKVNTGKIREIREMGRKSDRKRERAKEKNGKHCRRSAEKERDQ
jgi:hypothetical protein